MGGHWSSLEREPSPDPWWPDQQLPVQSASDNNVAGEEIATDPAGKSERGTVRQDELEVFKQELARKRVLRHEALAAVQAELKELRQRVEEERCLREQAEKERDRLLKVREEEIRELKLCPNEDEKKLVENGGKSKEELLRGELEKEKEEKRKLEEERDILMAQVEEKAGLQRQVQALKDVSEIGKEMLRIRELQVKELKKKLVEINISSVMAPPEDLRVEYEKQIENIRKLRTLYEERAAATLLEHRRELEREEARIVVLEIKLKELQKETDEFKEAKKELEEKIKTIENTLQAKESELETTKDNLFSSTVQNKSLNSQMTLINNLFSQMLVSPKVDLDRLVRLLKENHGLITDLTLKGDSNEVAALLVDLAAQVDKEETKDENDKQDTNESVEEEISTNLTKVWRVMVELLSHHQSPTHTELASGAESCYKCVETPSGPRSVISVSQTFLTLKDLILEKNQLVKEVGRLKTLNDHLEHRLGNQEKRLSVVTTELRKTWGVVNKLKAQHKQLHTHEKILRYELQQKRCMLTELKQELECCRDKWEKAREKNSQTEEDWKKLRKEFASRKSRKESNSAESGYEEEDVAHSPPSGVGIPIKNGDYSKLQSFEDNEQEASEDDIDHSDGNSFDTVIDLLDIAYVETQSGNETVVPLALCEVAPEASEILPTLLPLTGSEFTDGLDQIESPDLAAVLDFQYQNQLIGVDYNLSLPSSSGSSPIPTENDDFASSEMDISEEDSLSNSNNSSSFSAISTSNNNSSARTLPLSSTSSSNISKFLDGLLVENQNEENQTLSNKNLSLVVPDTSQTTEENGSATPLVSKENCSPSSVTPTENNNVFGFSFGCTQNEPTEDKGCRRKTQMKVLPKHDVSSPILSPAKSFNQMKMCEGKLFDDSSSSSSQEELLKIREDRLKRLEAQCRSLVNKVTSTSFRNEVVSNKLDKLHTCHDSSEYTPSGAETSSSKNTSQSVGKEDEQGSSKPNLDSSPKGKTNTSITTRPDIPIEEEISSSKTIGVITQSSSPNQLRSPEQVLEARAARLKRLEDQCKSLFSKMSATSSRSDLISNKLDELHNSYGVSEEKVDKHFPNESCLRRKSLHVENVKDQDIHSQPQLLSKVEETNGCKKFDLPSESKAVLNKCCLPGPSVAVDETQSSVSYKNRTPEQILEARAERFKRLEEQCKSLVSKMTATSLRSEIISNKLDELHSCYGSSEDASDGEDHFSSKCESRRKFTPTSSPLSCRKMTKTTEGDSKDQVNDAKICNSEKERVTIEQETNAGFPQKSDCGYPPKTRDPTKEGSTKTNMQRSNNGQASDVSETCATSDSICFRHEESNNQSEQIPTPNQILQPFGQTLSTTSHFEEDNAECDSSNESRHTQHINSNETETNSSPSNNSLLENP